jgi:glycosyltransferase involved in cell wall biosynthesis
MRIAINATCLNDRPSGAKQRFIGIYGSLFKELNDTEFIIYEPLDCNVTRWFDDQHNISSISTPIPSIGRFGKFSASLFYWGDAFKFEDFDIFESMHLPIVKYKNGINVLTIHDLRGLDKSNNFVNRQLYKKVLHLALQIADHVVTVSEAMKAEILEFFPHNSISVLYNGLNYKNFNNISNLDCESFLNKYLLPSGYLLAVGHLETRKNYHRLISSLLLLSKRGIDAPLVIIGNDSGEESKLIEYVNNLGLRNRVFILKGLSDLEVKCAYALSVLVIFPSLYEGFGIPILESMASGRPMVLSDIPVFKEITQNKYIYFSPYNIDSMSDAIELGLISSVARNKMIKYGYSRVQDFDFDILGKNLANKYLSLSS